MSTIEQRINRIFAEGLKPPPLTSVTEWADTNRILGGSASEPGQGNDSRAKPLNKHYAITKSRTTGGRAIRDLRLTGGMNRQSNGSKGLQQLGRRQRHIAKSADQGEDEQRDSKVARVLAYEREGHGSRSQPNFKGLGERRSGEVNS